MLRSITALNAVFNAQLIFALSKICSFVAEKKFIHGGTRREIESRLCLICYGIHLHNTVSKAGVCLCGRGKGLVHPPPPLPFTTLFPS